MVLSRRLQVLNLEPYLLSHNFFKELHTKSLLWRYLWSPTASGDDHCRPGRAGQPEAGTAPQQQQPNTQQSRHDQTSTEHWLTSLRGKRSLSRGRVKKCLCVAFQYLPTDVDSGRRVHSGSNTRASKPQRKKVWMFEGLTLIICWHPHKPDTQSLL